MSDYRNSNSDFRNPEDPFRDDAKMDPNVGVTNAAWGWIAAAVFLIVILAVAFGIGHQPGSTTTASNDMASPAATHMTPPPAGIVPPTALPTPSTPAPTIAPAPTAPAPTSGSQ